jgi:hypothetical protein
MAYRPELSAALQNIVLGEQPKGPTFQMPPTMPGMGTPPIAPQQMQPAVKPRSKGQTILGIIGDMLAAGSGGNPMFAQSLAVERQRAQDADAGEAIWSRRRQAENEDWTQRQQWQQAHPDPSPMVRDIQAWQSLGPEQRAAYDAMQKAKQGDPDVTVTLPNGQLYIGPKSGIAAALGGGGAPPRPVGSLTPIEGGPGGSPSGAGFPLR